MMRTATDSPSATDQADVAARQIFKPDDILVGCGHAALPEAD
jgi:hypothetical protein